LPSKCLRTVPPLTADDIIPVSPADVARISRIALQALSETHVIIPKEEFKALLADHTSDTGDVIWDLILTCYRNAAEQMVEALSPERQKGFELGLNLLERMHKVFLEENSTLFDENIAEI